MHQNKAVGIFTPFPQVIGGGERYIFTIAEVFSENGYSVDILSPFEYNLKEISEAFGLKLIKCNYKKISSEIFFIPPMKRKYELFFTLSNHIYPPVFGMGKYNTLIIQFPFPFPSKKIGDKIQRLLLFPKINSYQEIICYSEYVKKWIYARLPKQNRPILIKIIPPLVSVERFSSQKRKENKVLSVGRFFTGDHNKQHKLLIQTFKSLIDRKQLKGWEFHLAGSLSKDKKDLEYFNKLKASIKDYPIYLHPNISSTELAELYEKSKILWHGAGFNNNELLTPEKSEHFGIAIIEAMAAGVVPIVVNAGGLPEIIHHGNNGFLWTTLDELSELTLYAIGNKEVLDKLSRTGKLNAKKYSFQSFKKRILNLPSERV